MKAILMSIKPQHVANILNGIKTIEVRKRFPKDYVGWVYIYCTKAHDFKDEIYLEDFVEKPIDNRFGKSLLNGKVVARFWCDKVEYIENYYDEWRDGEEDYRTETLNPNKLYEKSCLPFEEMDKYLQGDYGYAIHITNLEIFDKPKELKEFHWYRKQWVDCGMDCPPYVDEVKHALTRAPQSWCYIEV